MQASAFDEVQSIIDGITDEAKRKELADKVKVLQRNVAANTSGRYPRTGLGRIRREAERWIRIMQSR